MIYQLDVLIQFDAVKIILVKPVSIGQQFTRLIKTYVRIGGEFVVVVERNIQNTI